jgi:hypothetical protein
MAPTFIVDKDLLVAWILISYNNSPEVLASDKITPSQLEDKIFAAISSKGV